MFLRDHKADFENEDTVAFILHASFSWHKTGWRSWTSEPWMTLTLVLAGGSRCNPPWVFFCDARRNMSRIVLKFCITYEAFFTQLLVKKLSASYQVMELWRHKRYKVRPFLREIAEYSTLEGDIEHEEASFELFRSELAWMTPQPYPLTFCSRSRQSKGQGQVSDLGWPYMFMCCLCL